MAKRKLKRFAEMKTFPNVFELLPNEISNADYKLKGKWRSGFFKNENPVILELGCGKGEYTVGLAENHPEKNFIGIDIKGARIWRGAKTAIEKNFSNVAFLRTRIEFIDSFFAKNEVNEIWITFPDPQPQKPKEKKRLTSLRFLNIYNKFLSKNGIIHLKTDNIPFYEFTLELIRKNNFFLIKNTNNLYGNSDEDNFIEAKSIQTFYEKSFLEKGMKICYLKFQLT